MEIKVLHQVMDWNEDVSEAPEPERQALSLL